MSQLTIVAHIVAQAEKVEQLKSVLHDLITPTLQEEGCITYDLHQDDDNPEHFMFYEIWASRELWQQHMSSEHISALSKVTEELIESVTLHEMTRLS
jgi:quinol monooxygenase YgiN